MSAEFFWDPVVEAVAVANALLRRLSFDDGMQLWVAEAAGQVVSTGRLEPVSGTEFAGIWGRATRQQWRGRGIYRALTATRARSAPPPSAATSCHIARKRNPHAGAAKPGSTVQPGDRL
jgi:hypothetical protein